VRGGGAGRVAERPQRVHRPAVPAACYLRALGASAARGAHGVPVPAPEPVLPPRRGALLPRPSRRAGRRPDLGARRPPLQRAPGQRLGLVRLRGVRGRPGGGRRPARGGARLAALPRPGSHGRPRGLRHERRVRDPHRGLRPRAAHPPAVAPALLRRAAGGGGPGQGGRPAHVGADDLRPREAPAHPLGARGEARARARHPDPQDVPPAAAARARPLRRDLQPRVAAQLGLRPLRPRGPRRARPGDAARLRARLVHGGGGREDRGGRGPGRHHAGHQPGPAQDGRPPAAAGLVALPAQGPDDGPGARGVPRRQAGVPARRRGRGALRGALQRRGAHAVQVGRDGLDPRDQPRDEPRHGGDGRPDRQALPDVRAGPL
ncbi:MAG: hypothetical protein AVDCRST_MAG13-945, partial [uncultured Solirubrobacteraceae bacterium]